MKGFGGSNECQTASYAPGAHVLARVCSPRLTSRNSGEGCLQVNSALHPSGVAKSSISFGWGKGGNVTSAGWQVTLCDPMWNVGSGSGVATLQAGP